MKYSWTNSTRLMCAASYQDRQLRDTVIGLFEENPCRPLAPCYGVDMDLVYQHCVQAKAMDRNPWVIIFCIAVTGAVLTLAAGPAAAILAAIAAGLVYWRYEAKKNAVLRNELSEDSFVRRTQDPATANGDAELIVYSGFSPFATAGNELSTWSFATNVEKGKCEFGRELTPDGFEVNELYSYIEKELKVLNIQNFTIDDIVCVHGRDVAKDHRFLPDPLRRPNQTVPAADLPEFVENRAQTGRHYKRVQILDWSGDLVFTLFFRFAKENRNLFCEVSYYVLTAIADKYRSVDELKDSTAAEVIGKMIGYPVVGAFMCIGSPFVLWKRITGAFANPETAQHKQIQESRHFDYGAQIYPRGMVSSGTYRRYFLMLDKDLYSKVVVRQFLDATIDFLDAHNVDTTDLRDRQTTIENHGVIVSGGDLNAEAVAVGKKSKASTVRSKKAGAGSGE